MIKLALGAGHGLYTSGKRNMKKLDPKETREWVMNNKIVTGVEEALKEYEGVETIRVDDPTGNKDVSLNERINKVNSTDIDMYVSFHHNIGANGGKGSGIEIYVANQASSTSKEYQKFLYNKLIDSTGLKGNRAQPLRQANFWVLSRSRPPAVLVEHGYMDSSVDVPIILSEEFVKNAIDGHVKALVEFFNLKKKKQETISHEGYSVCIENIKTLSDVSDLVYLLRQKGYVGRIIKMEVPDIIEGKYTEHGLDIISHKPENWYVEFMKGKNLRQLGVYGVNGTWQDKNSNTKHKAAIWGLVANKYGAIGPNSHQNSPNGHKRGTIIYYQDGTVEVKRVNNLSEIKKPILWAIGGGSLTPEIIPDENFLPDIFRKTYHTGIGIKDGMVVGFVSTNHCTMQEFQRRAKAAGIEHSIFVDGGGSSQWNYKDENGLHSSRPLASGFLVKNVK